MTKRKTPKSSRTSDIQAEDSTSVSVEVVDPEELTEEELSLRLHLERKVERSFYECGKAIIELRNKRLYRSTHKTFEEYCRDRFGFTHRSVNYLIAGSMVVDNLQKGTIGSQILPTSERQVRPLTKLEPDLQCEVWQLSVEEAGGKVPSGRIVKDIVERLKEKPLYKAGDFCLVGDVFILTKLDATERKYNGCWAIALALNEFTVEVAVHDNTLIVKPENLNKIDSPEAQHQLPLLKQRIWRLRDRPELDRGAYTVLESLGRQSYLTDVEFGLLQWLEEYYGVGNLDSNVGMDYTH